MDSVIDEYGKDYLDNIIKLENGQAPETTEAVAGQQAGHSEDAGILGADDDNAVNADIVADNISDIPGLNDRLISLYQRYSSYLAQADSLNRLIKQCNGQLTELNREYGPVDSIVNEYNKSVEAYSDTAMKFIHMNRNGFDPGFCYEKWELFKKGHFCKLAGWKLILKSMDYYEKIGQIMQKKRMLMEKQKKLNRMVDEYYFQYNRLKKLYRTMEKELN